MKFNIAIHFFLILSFSYTVTAQDCLPDGIILRTQKQIDNFPNNYPGCSNIKGNVRIEERNTKNITNLNSLSQITSIEGSLKVSGNTKLTSLKGLNNITSIGGQFGIWGNSSLENITDLEKLISINGHLTISNNTSLMSLSGLNNLTFIEGFLRVKENDSLTSLDGLDNLFSIGKDLWIGSNDNLKNLNGLGNLTSIKENLKVTDNKILVDVNGLKNLTSIGKSLKIMNNDSLLSLSVLSNVTSIGGRIHVANNTSLVYQNELDKLSSASEEEIKSVKENIIIKKNVKNANDDKKWEFGVEAGYASMKLQKSNSGFNLFESETEEIKHSSNSGFRVSGIAKYNINDRFQFIGGLGIVRSKSNANKITEDSGGTKYRRVKTTIKEDIIQNYTLIEIPVYLRFHLFGKHKPVSDNFNIFFDLGGSFKMPLNNKSSFTRDESISTTINTYESTGWFSERLVDSETTSTPSSQEGGLELQSKFNEYLAIGILVGDRTSIAFTSSRINIQSKLAKDINHKSNLNSVSVTVFF